MPLSLTYLTPNLAKISLAKKKNGQISQLHQLERLKKACSKYEFLLPNIDMLVNANASHLMFPFIDMFSGYSSIKMHSHDAETTAFRTLMDNFQYTIMSFVILSHEYWSNLPTNNGAHLMKISYYVYGF